LMECVIIFSNHWCISREIKRIIL